MENEFAMQVELFKTDFCFSRYDLYDKEKNYDYSQKFYAFDCNIGGFYCYATKENLLKIVDIAKKYNLEDLFLNKTFNKINLLNFKCMTNNDLRQKKGLSDDYPVIFYFLRGCNYSLDYNAKLKEYLEL
jgi:hypothetical protein